MFLHIPQVLNDSQLRTVCAALGAKDAPWVDGRMTAGHQSAAVKHNQQLEESSPLAQELGRLLAATLERNPVFVSATLPNRLFPPVFNRYGQGMQFASHVDGCIRVLGQGQKLRCDLSATLFLSTRDAYQGGELVVENDFGNQRVKLDAGDMIVYPAAGRHLVTPIESGERLAAVFWVQSLVRGDAERLQLFELDRTIQRLTELNTDTESLVRLTAHYHSLLRLWADT